MEHRRKANSVAGSMPRRMHFVQWLLEQLQNKSFVGILEWREEILGIFTIRCKHGNTQGFSMTEHGRLYIEWAKTNPNLRHVFDRDPEQFDGADCNRARDSFWTLLEKYFHRIRGRDYGKCDAVYQFKDERHLDKSLTQEPLDLSLKKSSSTSTSAAAAGTTLAHSQHNHHHQQQQHRNDEPILSSSRAPSHIQAQSSTVDQLHNGAGLSYDGEQPRGVQSRDNSSIPLPALRAMMELNTDERYDVICTDQRVSAAVTYPIHSASNEDYQGVAASAAIAAAQRSVEPTAMTTLTLSLPRNMLADVLALIGMYVLPVTTPQQVQLANQPPIGGSDTIFHSSESSAASATLGAKPTSHRRDTKKSLSTVQTGVKKYDKQFAKELNALNRKRKECADSMSTCHISSGASFKRQCTSDHIPFKVKDKRYEAPDTHRNLEQTTTSSNEQFFDTSHVNCSANARSGATSNGLVHIRTPTISPSLRGYTTLDTTSFTHCVPVDQNQRRILPPPR